MVTSSFPKAPGDVTAPFIESIGRAVAARGHEVDVLLPDHPDLQRGRRGPLRLFPFPYAPFGSWSLWGYAQSLERDVRVRPAVYALVPLVAVALRRALSRRLVERRYDVVHAHWVVPNAAMVGDQVRSHGLPLVVSLHGSDVFLAERFPPARALARRALLRAGAVTACSGDLGRRGVALGARRDRLRVVPYGVDASLFAPSSSGAATRARLGVVPEVVLVLAFGRLVEKKGFAHLVEAVSRLSGVQLVLAGDGDLRRALEDRARVLGAPVSFAGSLPREEMAEALAAADVVAVPSVVDSAGNVDGLPNALLEAMAAGRAVVASRVAGIPDVMEDGVDGLLVPPGDATALGEAIGRLARDGEVRARMGGAARRRARKTLTWEAAAAALEDCYAQAAALDAR
jgi:glycosyltransferase involved in cell wall biosynthesis